jgi:predicted 2-oxoglutarate/Fe(II)-dependent dioxygenase YbiX
VFDCLLHLPPPEQRAGLSIQAPVLVLPDVFEQSLCAELVDAYERQGGVDSTVQRDDGGMSVNQVDASAKRRKDVTLRDRELTLRLRRAMERRVLPEILKAYQFKASHIERYLVGCYAAEDQAHFGAHRDNTHKAVAHRKFAVSVNLNDGFEGGEVVFPEYGSRGFRTAAGGALVFSCALLHAVTPVTRGRRYAFLPFIYDEDGARLRSENAGFLRPGPPVYVGG